MAFIKVQNIKIEGNMWLGSTIKITVIFNTAPTSVNITIEDSSGIDQVDRVTMTQETGSIPVYTYTYQSAETDNEGTYEVIIRGVSGANTSLDVYKFELADADDD